jgi:hypothetical protein
MRGAVDDDSGRRINYLSDLGPGGRGGAGPADAFCRTRHKTGCPTRALSRVGRRHVHSSDPNPRVHGTPSGCQQIFTATMARDTLHFITTSCYQRRPLLLFASTPTTSPVRCWSTNSKRPNFTPASL